MSWASVSSEKRAERERAIVKVVSSGAMTDEERRPYIDLWVRVFYVDGDIATGQLVEGDALVLNQPYAIKAMRKSATLSESRFEGIAGPWRASSAAADF
jgi:hypothetical protein